MSIKRPVRALGPGTLIIGAPGSQLDISCQTTATKVTFDSDKEDDVPTLCGGVIAGEKNYTAKLEFTVGQDLEEDGVIDWTWAHAGEQHPVQFIPRSGEGAEINGTIVVDPIEYGGDVKKKNLSDAEWDFVGLPSFTPDATADSEAYPVMTVKTITLPGGTTGGTFTLTINGETTAAIPYNATVAQLKAALEALDVITSIMSVTAGALSWTVTFSDTITTMTGTGTSLTPSGSVTVV